jgi:hypothetical protein
MQCSLYIELEENKMSDLFTRKIDIEVSSSPQFVEVFITYIDPRLKRFGGNREQFLISIPIYKFSFFLPVNVELREIDLILEEDKIPGAWSKQLAEGIYHALIILTKQLND